MPSLYPQSMCSANVHSLIHLCGFVRLWGPLWCYSTFGFENMNGYMKKHCHGTRNVLPQLIQSVAMRQALSRLHKRFHLQENKDTMLFLSKLGGGKSLQNGPLGRIKKN